jgi:chromosome segregation ATPase
MVDLTKLRKSAVKKADEELAEVVGRLKVVEDRILEVSELLSENTKALASTDISDPGMMKGIFRNQEALRDELAELRNQREVLVAAVQRTKEMKGRRERAIQVHKQAIQDCREERKALNLRIKYHQALIDNDKSAVRPKAGPIIMKLQAQIRDLTNKLAMGGSNGEG